MGEFAVPLEELIAHRQPMCFLDRILAVDDTMSVAEAHVDRNNPLYVPGRGLPAYVGVEMMAQAIAAIDGMKRKMEGLPPKIGFLLGCRRYNVRCAEFAEDARLKVVANMVFNDGAMFSFECRIEGEGGETLATATMNVFAPVNPRAFLDGTAA